MAVDKENVVTMQQITVRGIFREKRRGKRESRNIVWYSRMTDGSQSARLPIPLRRRCHPSCVAKDLAESYYVCSVFKREYVNLAVQRKERQEGKSSPLFVEALRMSKRREVHELVSVKRCVGEERLPEDKSSFDCLLSWQVT